MALAAMAALAALAVIVGLPRLSAAQTVQEVKDDILGNVTWPKLSGIYLVTEQVEIAEGATLTIQPGAVVKFRGGAGLTVRGTLIAQGAPADSIVFTSAADDNHAGDLPVDGPTHPASTDWDGVRFAGAASGASVMAYCQVWYGGGGAGGALVQCDAASPSITYSSLNAGVYGVRCENGAAPAIHDTRIDGCDSVPIVLGMDCDPGFDNLVFGSEKDNGYDGIGVLEGPVRHDAWLTRRAARIGADPIQNLVYVLLGKVTVGRDATLRLQPGLVLKAVQAASLEVHGSLEAVGAAGDEIVWTSVRDDAWGTPDDTNRDESRTAPAAGDWGGLVFADSSSGRLESCRLRFGGQEALIDVAATAGLVVRDCVLGDAASGVRAASGTTLELTGNEFRGCRGAPLVIGTGTLLTQSNNVFRANGLTAVGVRTDESVISGRLARLDMGGYAGITYYVAGTLNVGASLRIDPGVTLKFAPGATGIDITGLGSTLIAGGTSAQRIVFTSLRDDCAGNPRDTEGNGWEPGPCPGDWGGLLYGALCDTAACVLTDCDFSFGGYDNVGVLHFLGIVPPPPAWSGCRLAWNLIGLRVEYFPAGIAKLARAGESPPWRPAPRVAAALGANNFGGNVVPVLLDWGGTMSHDATLGPFPEEVAGIPVVNRLATDLVVPFGITLTLEKGLKIAVGDAGIIVRGALVGDGGETPIDFHAWGPGDLPPFRMPGEGGPPTGFDGCPLVLGCDPSELDPLELRGKAVGGPWRGITFENTSDDAVSRLRRMKLTRATNAVTVRNASPVLLALTVEGAAAEGIRIEGRSHPTIDSCLVRAGGSVPLAMSLMSDPIATGNRFVSNALMGIGVLGETLARDFTLAPRDMAGLADLPYVVLEDLAVGSGVTLTLEPGVELKFLKDRRLDVATSLVARGGAAPDSAIVFTSVADDFYGGDSNGDGAATTGADEPWGGLRLARTAELGPIVLEHCVFRYAGAEDGAGAVDVTGACSPLLRECTFARNARGVVYHEAAGDSLRGGIESCDFGGNREFAVQNLGRVHVVRARGCWWGDPSGPFDGSDDRAQGGFFNPQGLGDAVSDGVAYAPWRTDGARTLLLGDVSLNQEVTAYDASLVLQSVVGSLALTPPQQRVADVTCAAGVTALDAACILRVAARLDLFFPCEAESAQNKATAKLDLSARDARIALESLGGPDGAVRYAVTWTGTTPLLAAEIAMRADGGRFGAVGAGAAAQGALLSSRSDGDGSLRIVLAAAEPIAPGSLVEIAWEPVAGSGADAPLRLVGARLNERTVLAEDAEPIPAPPLRLLGVVNRPNPFNPTTVISFVIAGEAGARLPARVTIHDQYGRRVRRLLDDALASGPHEVIWDGRAEGGATVASGVYICRVEAGREAVSRKLILVK